MTLREQTEALEREMLSPFACLSSQSRGRQTPLEPCPTRTCFQRDIDRIIHSKAFRRLKLELEAHGGVLGEVEYAADVTVHALLPEERAEAFSARLTELAAGGVAAQVCGESFQAVPRTQV